MKPKKKIRKALRKAQQAGTPSPIVCQDCQGTGKGDGCEDCIRIGGCFACGGKGFF